MFKKKGSWLSCTALEILGVCLRCCKVAQVDGYRWTGLADVGYVEDLFY
jgi:hypothetical protein